MQGLAFYEQVCRAYREGRGEPPKVVFARAAQRVLTGEAIRHALDSTRRDSNEPCDVEALRGAMEQEFQHPLPDSYGPDP